jgi:hypothetical protein
VLISDSVGSSLSQTANPTVRVRPAIVQQPLSVSAVPGDDVTFSIAVTGTLPLNFSWRLGSRVLTNITLNQSSCFFTVHSVQPTNAGNYRVGITNGAGPASSLSSNAVLTILADSDHDGLPDTWESANGLNPNDSAEADLDLDGDGMTNRQEYRAGTDPQNGQSKLQFESIHLDLNPVGAVKLSFLALSNRTYAVEYRDALALGDWIPLAEVVATSTNRLVQTGDSFDSSLSQRFYRLITPVVH